MTNATYHGLREAINRANTKATRKASEANRAIYDLVLRRNSSAVRVAKAVRN